MSEKVYVLNVYNTMTGQYELIKRALTASRRSYRAKRLSWNAFLTSTWLGKPWTKSPR